MLSDPFSAVSTPGTLRCIEVSLNPAKKELIQAETVAKTIMQIFNQLEWTKNKWKRSGLEELVSEFIIIVVGK